MALLKKSAKALTSTMRPSELVERSTHASTAARQASVILDRQKGRQQTKKHGSPDDVFRLGRASNEDRNKLNTAVALLRISFHQSGGVLSWEGPSYPPPTVRHLTARAELLIKQVRHEEPCPQPRLQKRRLKTYLTVRTCWRSSTSSRTPLSALV